MPADNRYAFLVEWLDPQAQLVRQYLLFFYSIDGTVEMDDIKNRRKFLRRCEYPGEDVDVQTRHAWRGSSSESNSADRARVSWKGGVRQAPTLRQPARADAVFAVFFQESRSMIYTLGQQ